MGWRAWGNGAEEESEWALAIAWCAVQGVQSRKEGRVKGRAEW